MYAEHVLRVPVDWSTLPSTGFGRLSEIYLTRKPAQIPYVVVPVWFRSDPTLLDNPESPIPANRKSWSRSRPRKRKRVSADNELDRDLGAAFAQMEMIGAGEAMTRADGAFTGADGVSTGPDEVLTGPKGVMARPDGVEIRGVHNISAEEQSKLLADVAAYKAQISFLESSLLSLVSQKTPQTMTPLFGLKNSLKIELWNNQKIKRKTKHQCPQLQFFLRMRQIGRASVR
jgi:hypothetical protein